LIEQFLARAGVEREEICERVPEKKREQGDRSRDAHGAEENAKVDRILEQRGEVVEAPSVDDYAVADEPKTVRKHEGVGKEKESRDPE
jgi:hypothetical protein